MDKYRRGKNRSSKRQNDPCPENTAENWDPLILVLSSDPTPRLVQELLDKLGVRRGRRTRVLGASGTPPPSTPPPSTPPPSISFLTPPPSTPPPSTPPPSTPPPATPPPSLPSSTPPPSTPPPSEESPYSTHKNRADWFVQRFAYPAREVHVGLRPQAQRQMQKPPQAPALWKSIGPPNVAGRMTSLVCDPKDPTSLYAGSAGGGVWHSPDAGKTWSSLWDDPNNFDDPSALRVLNVGSLAIDSGGNLYAGTGEANLSGDNHSGNGVFKFDKRLDKWFLLNRGVNVPPRIGTIAIDPKRRNRIRIGGVCHLDRDPCGMFVLEEGSWVRENNLVSERNYYCHSIVFRPDGNAIFAAVDARGTQSGIWRYDDPSWKQLTRGLPPGDQFGRTSLAVAPSDPDIIYAVAADRMGGVLGIFRSEDGGESWVEIGRERFRAEGQMSYNNCIAVDPRNPDYVIWGGIDLYRTQNGGVTWETAAKSKLSLRLKRSPRYVHQDHHALLIVPYDAGTLIYDGNDGGVSVSYDGGNTWEDRSRGLETTMFYDVDVAQSDSKARIIAGGSQDNGTLMTRSAPAPSPPPRPGRQDMPQEESKPGDFFMKVPGDGGWIVFDPSDATHFYASSERMHIYRRRVGALLREVTPAGLTEYEHDNIWMSFIEIDPEDPKTVFTASDRVWRTLDDGRSWQASRSLDGSPVSAIELATRNRRRIYVGTENGGFFRSEDGGDTWSQNLAGPELPGRIITRIEARPDDENLVYLTVGSVAADVRFSNLQDQVRGKRGNEVIPAFAHVFLSPDAGDTWQDADPQRSLPNSPHLALTFETHWPYRLFVAGDFGVFMLDDGIWQPYTDNLPRVIVTDLVYHKLSSSLTAATYGRGIWQRFVPRVVPADAAQRAKPMALGTKPRAKAKAKPKPQRRKR